MQIGGLQKTTLIDYPEKIAAIVFTCGCNFRCPYCHNPELVNRTSKNFDEQAVLDFLETRMGKLDGVVVTGGEPTLQKDLPDFLQKLKSMGFSVKIDTNGSQFEMLEQVIKDKLVDYIAMDIKAPVEKYENVVNTNFNIENILKSINLIMKSGIKYEFRTTVVQELLSPDDFEKIGFLTDGADKYFIQNFVLTKVLANSFIGAKPFTQEQLNSAREYLFNHNIKSVNIR